MYKRYLSESRRLVRTPRRRFLRESEGKIKVKSKEELKQLIKDESVYLGDLDVSGITDMSNVFYSTDRKDFSGIENWNVSNVKNMYNMFWGAENFNQDISRWNVSNVKYMDSMFWGAKNFNQDISRWNLSNVKNTNDMFTGCPIKEEFMPTSSNYTKYNNIKDHFKSEGIKINISTSRSFRRSL